MKINGDDRRALIRGEDLPPFRLVGRKEELRKLLSILIRDRASSVLLVGSGGVGASSLCYGLQELKTATDPSYDALSKRLFWLNTDELFASGDSKSIGEEFKRMINILRSTSGSVLIIDDAKDFIDGVRQSHSNHFLNMLMAAVTGHKTQVIMEVRDDSLVDVLKAHSDFRDSFTIMELHEPNQEDLFAIVAAGVKRLTTHHMIETAPGAVSKAIELTMKFRDGALDRAQPSRAITLLDRALASYRIQAHQTLSTSIKTELNNLSQKLRDAEDQIIQIEDKIFEQQAKETEKAEKKEGSSALGGFETSALATLRQQLFLLKKEAEIRRSKFNEALRTANSEFILGVSHVKETFTRISGMVPDDEDEGTKILKFEERTNKRIFGQESAIKRVATMAKVARFGRNMGPGPKGRFMFLGPSGVGKTETARAMAHNLLGDERLLLKLDMGEYMEKHAVAKLIGAPPGYELAEVGGVLTNAMRKNPYRVVLFDEIEKAHQDLADVFLAVVDDGRLTDNVGRTATFEEAYVVFTGNIGAHYFLDPTLTLDQANEAAMEELATKFKPEFLNRFDGRQGIIPFAPLSYETMEKITGRHLDAIQEAYGDQIIFSLVPDSVRLFVADHYDTKVGARGLPGYIKRYLDGPIVDWRAANEGRQGRATILYKDGDLVVDFSD
jgi:ATP-dependent Clp protease ATP-binding subunit ClpB